MKAHAEQGLTLVELAVALAVMAVLLPMVATAASVSWRTLTGVTVQTTLASTARQVLGELAMQLGGAQPQGYCPGAPGSLANPLVELSTPLSSCPAPAAGPPAIPGAPGLPSPAGSACGTPAEGPAAVVVATGTCLGFFAYDYQGTAASQVPLSPPELVYAWAGAGGLWVSYYAPATGATYTNPSWASTALRRFVGTTTTSAPFSYTDSCGAAWTPAEGLGAISVVTVDATFSLRSQSLTERYDIALTGNAYNATAAWNAAQCP